MNFIRRDFVKQIVALSALIGSGIAGAATGAGPNVAPASKMDADIQKSIKANFGGGFSVLSHSKLASVTYAKIENFGNQYTVRTTDLIEWKIIKSSL